jgi:hypothetical protein
MNDSIRFPLLLALLLASAPLFAAPQEPSLLEEPAEAAETLLAPAPEITMFRMRDGSIQWGSVEDHAPDMLTFRRLDTGGVVVLPWAFLDAEQEYDMRVRFGYIELGGDEIMTSAEMLIMLDGQEVVGRILGRTENTIKIKSAGLTLDIPKSRVRSHVVGLQVPALEIYTKDELYATELLKIDLEDPQAHFDMGAFCERILDFARALEHYQSAAELDPEFMPKEMEVIVERVSIKVLHQEQIDALAEVDHLNRRKKYGEALLALAFFDSNYPDSPLGTDRRKLEERVLEARDKHLHVQVAKRWFAWMSKLAAKAAREKGFEETLSYLEENFSEEIVARVTEEMRRIWPEIEEDVVRQIFTERKRGRWKPASYGMGTWLLGEDDALKGLETVATEKKSESPLDSQRAKYEDQIKRFLKNQAMAKRARKSDEDEAEVEKEWTILSSSARRNWIIAYYAENGGELDVRPKAELRNCSECGGTGVLEVIYTGSSREGAVSGLKLIPCPTCHGIGRVRRVRYR